MRSPPGLSASVWHSVQGNHFHFLKKLSADTHLKEWFHRTQPHVEGHWCWRPYRGVSGTGVLVKVWQGAFLKSQFNLLFLNWIMAPYRRSSSLVRRKLRIGAKAVGSLSINIWKRTEPGNYCAGSSCSNECDSRAAELKQWQQHKAKALMTANQLA